MIKTHCFSQLNASCNFLIYFATSTHFKVFIRRRFLSKESAAAGAAGAADGAPPPTAGVTAAAAATTKTGLAKSPVTAAAAAAERDAETDQPRFFGKGKPAAIRSASFSGAPIKYYSAIEMKPLVPRKVRNRRKNVDLYESRSTYFPFHGVCGKNVSRNVAFM